MHSLHKNIAQRIQKLNRKNKQNLKGCFIGFVYFYMGLVAFVAEPPS